MSSTNYFLDKWIEENNIQMAHHYFVYEPNTELIKNLSETEEPNMDYYDDDMLWDIMDEDEPIYEYPGTTLPAYLKFTDDGIDVYAGDRIGHLSPTCVEEVRNLLLTHECQCQVVLGGGMCANYINGHIYREFEDYYAILEITHPR